MVDINLAIYGRY